MRDLKSWCEPIITDLGRIWRQHQIPMKLPLFCQVELGLRLQERLDPDAHAEGVWTLLGGYPFAQAAGLIRTEADNRMIASARHLLWPLRRHRTWRHALDSYQEVDERFRGYRVAADGGSFRWVEPAHCGQKRLDIYDRALDALPDFARQELPVAGPGQSRFLDRRRYTSVTFPDELEPVPARGHRVDGPSTSGAENLSVPLEELTSTARWIEETEHASGLTPGNWVQRLNDLTIDARSDDGHSFEETSTLRLERPLHMVGMVGAGKSTLMVLLAVWAARKGMRTTLVVGDVAEQLRLTEFFRDLFPETASPVAAPVLGSTTRERHVQRLHRRLAARGNTSLLSHHEEPAFDHLSTVCVVDALRGTEPRTPLRYADAPCGKLYPTQATSPPDEEEAHSLPGPYPGASRDSHPEPQDEEHDDPPSGPPHGCPLWSVCPRHKASRELVDALIWVANPASLVQTPVPQHLNEERLRHLELACIRSDIVIVDEVDRVQMQLDEMFAPSATLVTRGPESWLDQLHTHKIGELSRQGRLPLSEQDVERWATSLEVASTATNRLYSMLINDDDLRDWAEIEYFSAWTLQEKLLNEWYPPFRDHAQTTEGLPDESEVYDSDDLPSEASTAQFAPGPDSTPWAEHRRRVTEALDAFRDDPLGGRGPHEPLTTSLIELAQDLLHTLNEQTSLARVRTFLGELLEGSPAAEGTLRTPRPRADTDPDPADTPGSDPWFTRTAKRVAFTLRLAVLHHRLDRLTFLWPQVEAAMRLESTDNELSRRPPLDYAPLVPEAPMGNVLGFQYLPEDGGRARDPEGRRSGTLRFFRCAGVGRELLLSLPQLGADPGAGRHGPHVMMMSGTSWAGTSTRAHVLAPVKAVLKPDPKSLHAIRDTVFRPLFLYDNGKPLSLSGHDPQVRPAALRQMVRQLAGPRPGGLYSHLEEEFNQIRDVNRQRALLLVGSYEEAARAADCLEEMERWHGRVRVLAADDAELDHAVGARGRGLDGSRKASALRRGDLASFAEDPDAELLVAPLLAIERGHNVLNAEGKAAFGTVLFLARPHPRPDDLSLAIFAINDWAARFVRDYPNRSGSSFSKLVNNAADLNAAGGAFRHAARGEWRRLLSRRYIYSWLDKDEKESFTWDQLVTIWQVIGRLVRGGVPARVRFVDARFAPKYAARTAPGADAAARAPSRHPEDGLLAGLREILAPYFASDAAPSRFDDPADPALVRMLYQPLYDALCGMEAADGH